MTQYGSKPPGYLVTQVTPLRHDEYGIDNSDIQDYDSAYRPNTQIDYEQISTHGRHTENLPRNTTLDLSYKPSPLRWPFLVAVLVAAAGFIGITEYACRTLPAEVDRGFIPKAAPAQSPTAFPSAAPKPLMLRQIQSSAPAVSSPPTPPAGTPTNSISTPSSTSDPAVTSITFAETRPQSDYGKDGSVTISDPEVTETRPQGDYGNGGSVTLAYSRPEGDYGNDGTVTESVSSTLSPSNYGNLGPTTVNGVATTILPTYVTATVQTLSDSAGHPTATIVETPDPISTPTSITLTDSNGRPTATLTSTIVVQPTTSVLTDSSGVATATITQYPVVPTHPASRNQNNVYYISKWEYVIGFFLPTILSVLLTIPIRMIDRTAHQLQPFHELTHSYGSDARDSLCQQTGGIHAVVQSVKSIFGGKALIFLTTLLVTCSGLLVPLSSEAVALKIHGSCATTNFRGCAMTLGVFLWPARATMALLGLMGLTILAILLFLRGWSSGVASNPWSIASIASLSTNLDIRALFSALPNEGKVKRRDFLRILEGTSFRLGSFISPNGISEYGIMFAEDAAQFVHQGFSTSSTKLPPTERQSDTIKQGRSRKHHQPFFMLSIWGRLLYIILTCGLLAVILYYNNTGGDTPFERFMDNQSFGVRFLFTAVGIGIAFFRGTFFTSIATISPYYLLSLSPKYARNSILLSPPSNAFTGLFAAIHRRHFYMAAVALTSIFSEFMPILLNNIPFRITQTFVTHRVCTWLAVGILCVMLLVVLASFFIKWPHMPADVATIAGSMYYVFDSGMLWSFEGLGAMSQNERDWKISEMGMRYSFGEMTGVSGMQRSGVDAVDGGKERV